MSKPTDMPPVGTMYLYDAITPPLPDGQYRFQVSSKAPFDNADHGLSLDRHFDIDGPRFALPPDGVALVYPPRNGHGSFDESFPQAVLGRRTLPWERPADRVKSFGTPKPVAGLPALTTPVPWMALLVFDEDECEIHQQVPLEQVVPKDVFDRLGRPQGIVCDCVEADEQLMKEIMPSRDELILLTHVRQVNIDDRELAAGDSDGWFAVVMSNRLPRAGRKHVACLVSVEERSDLVAADPPAVAPKFHFERLDDAVAIQPLGRLIGTVSGDVHRGLEPGSQEAGPLNAGDFAVRGIHERSDVGIRLFESRARLVLLYRWEFTSDGDGTFRTLMQKLDVGLFGTVAEEGRPAVSDTGHVPLTLDSRAGVEESVWYRGPLVPHQLTRDTLGPYHSADQARRVSPETGAEDVTYAAAFEIGRLLAAADGRLAQELMRWRRGAYHESYRGDLIGFVESRLPIDIPPESRAHLQNALVPIVESGVLERIVDGAGPIADVYHLAAAERAPGLDPALLADAWGLASPGDARVLLEGASLAPPIDEIARPPDRAATIDDVVADTASLGLLAGVRRELIDKATTRTEETP